MMRFATVRSIVMVALLYTSPVLCEVQASPKHGPAESGEFVLRLGGLAFDPVQGEPVLPPLWDRSAAAVADLHLVQFDGPIPADAYETLRDGGFEPVQYIHPFTYIVWGLDDRRASLARAGGIRWTGSFAPAFRVLPQWRGLAEDPVDVNVLIYRGADADAVTAAISRLGGEPGKRTVVNQRFEIAGFRIAGDLLQAAASIPGVYSIQPQKRESHSRGEVTCQVNAGNLDVLGMAYPGYVGWLNLLDLHGTGVTVALVDEGVDETHPDLLARVVPCTGSSCSVTPSIHGTHTAGILAGDGSSAVLDAYGFLRGQGVAPGADLVEQEYYPLAEQPGGILGLMAESQRNGAEVSNNSWGTAIVPKGYDIDAMLVDTGVRDADPERPGNQPLIYVLAINNGQGGTSTQGAPDEAKNTITVGASKGLAPDGTQDPDIDDLAEQTAHGPALDGRTIPHIVAPGCQVDGPYPDFGEGHDHHTRCGTSEAAPQVTGAIALFLEYFRNLPGYTADPSPALVKAALLPVAHDLEGALDADGAVMGHRPDSKQGWGRLNLAALIDPPAGSVIYYDQHRVFEESSKEWLREVEPVDPGLPMQIMLVWTDAPGHGLGGDTAAISNDLDLVVEAGGNTYLGNDFGSDGYSTTGGAADDLNTAEGVFLEFPPSRVTIRVQAANITSNGVPNFNDETDQDFALVCYNCAYIPDFALNPDPVTSYVCAPDQADVLIDVEQHTGYSEPVTLSLANVPAGVSESFDTNPVVPGGSSLLTLDPGNAVAGDYEMQLNGDTMDMSRSHPLYLRLRTDLPAPAVLTDPADAAVDVFPRPVLEWDPVTWAAQYVVEVATDAAFENLFYTALTKGTSHTMTVSLAQDTVYHWRVRASNVCGFGAFSAVFSFTTRDVFPVLLVDEHDETYDPPGVQGDYTAALDALGVSYDIWDIWALGPDQEPAFADLVHYDKVIWFTGREEIYAGPTPRSEGELETWFERASGCLLMSSADYVLNSEFSSFIQQYLGVSSAVEDTGQSEVTPAGSVFGAMAPGPYGLKNLNNDYSDSLTPDGTAEVAFTGDQGDTGVNKDGAYYRTSFMGYGMERLGSIEMQDTLSTFLDWCDGLADVDGDLDGILNGADCAPGDVDAWTAPEEITDLTLGKGGAGEYDWTEPVSGGGSEYDVLRSTDHADWWHATCVASGVSGPPPWGDDDPLPGELFFYQVRARSDCGMSSLGQNPDGSPRHGTACE